MSREAGHVKEAVWRSATVASRYIELTQSDIETLRRMKPRVQPLLPSLAGRVAHLLVTDPEAKPVFEKGGIPESSPRELFEDWLHLLFDSSYDERHALRLAGG